MRAPIHPHFRTIPFRDPVAAAAAFAGAPGVAFLDSAEPARGRGRYSYLAVDPYAVIEAGAGTPDPLGRLAEALGEPRLEVDPAMPPFQTGAVGYLGYELAGSLERLPQPQAVGPNLPAMWIGLFDTIAAFDHETRQAWVIAADLASDPSTRPPVTVRAETLARRIAAAPELAVPSPGPAGQWEAEQSPAAFQAAVARAIDYIHAGDIYQANLSQRFLARQPRGLSPWALYRRLRAEVPAPFGAFVNCGGGRAVLSASPERFLRLDAGGRVETRPIKGTRRRGADPVEDAALAIELQASAKDRAENLMIVDLLRNDLSRVARAGSVSVPALCELETFSRVHHLVSEVRAQLVPGLGAVDLLRAAFPGGSITGAPKIRAMEVIRELEPARRGPYCGSLLWIGADGAMDSSIVIRTLVVDGDTVIAQAGGGVVADSDPAAEYAETLIKARPLLAALDPEVRGWEAAA